MMHQLKEIMELKTLSSSFLLRVHKETATVSETAYIKDKAQTNYNYSITSNAGSSDPITEGGKITFTITRVGASNSDADKESTIYLNTANDTASFLT